MNIQSELLCNKEVTLAYELAAIFVIVFRNLNLSKWHRLMPEAQMQMLEEVQLLLDSPYLSIEQKSKLEMQIHSISARVISF